MSDESTPHHQNGQYSPPELDPVIPPKPPLFKRLFGGFGSAFNDPNSATTFRTLIAVGLLLVVASWFLGGSDDIETPKYENINRTEGFGPAEQGALSAEEESRIIEENEAERLRARKAEETYTPDRLAVINFLAPDPDVPAEKQIVDACRSAIEAGKTEGVRPEEIVLRASNAAGKMAKDRGQSDKEVIDAAVQCARIAADQLGLSHYQQIQLASAAVQRAAAALGQSEEEQVALAARVAQETAKALGLSEEEQVAAAADAARQAAENLGWNTERQILAAASAAQNAAIKLGWDKKRLVAAGARAAQLAALHAGLSEADQVAWAAKVARQTAQELGFSEEDQIALAALAAQTAAQSLGWSEDRQVAAAAKAAQQAAAALGFTEEQQVAAAARAAQMATHQLGWSAKRHVAAAGRAAQEAAKSLGWNQDRQIMAAGKAALVAAQALGMSETAQIMSAASAAQKAAAALGLSESDQVQWAGLAAREAAASLSLDPESQLAAAALAAEGAAKALGMSEEQQIKAAGEGALAAAKRLNVESEQVAGLVNNALQQSGLNAEVIKNQIQEINITAIPEKSKTEFSPAQIVTVVANLIRKDREERSDNKNVNKEKLKSLGAVATVTEWPKEKDPSSEKDITNQPKPSAVDHKIGEAKKQSKGPPAVAAGRMLYGVEVSRVNTDYARPEVIGTVVGGAFDGAWLIGTWERRSDWEETIGLVFNRMNYQGYEVDNVELIAFHPESNLPGFATKVDHHYLQRFVGIAMKAVGEGGKAAINARRELTTRVSDDTGNVTGETWQPLDSEEARKLFFAESLDVLGEHSEKWSARPVTVDVYHEGMKLLVMNNLYMPEELQRK